MIKAEFSASLLQSHDPSEIIQIFWFAAQNTFIIIIIIIIIMYYENSWVDFFSGFFDEQKVQKNSIDLK